MHANSLKPEPISGAQPLGSGAPRKRGLFIGDESPMPEALCAVLRLQQREWEKKLQGLLEAAPRVRDEAWEMLLP